MTAATLARSYLFVPATRPERVPKARAAGADAIIVDLEDAVAAGDKDSARDALASCLDPAQPVIVRINGVGSDWFERDLAACRRPGIAAIMVPKAEFPDRLRAVHDECGLPVIALIETAQGLWNALDIARADGVQRLAFGALDFRLDLGLPEGSDDALNVYRAQLVLASRVANIAPPIDSPTPQLTDETSIRRDSLRARSLGFGGKLCVHPAQVASVNAAFSPSPEEVAWATRVIEAARSAGGAAVAVDGKMIDRPVLDLAQRLLAQAARGQP